MQKVAGTAAQTDTGSRGMEVVWLGVVLLSPGSCARSPDPRRFRWINRMKLKLIACQSATLFTFARSVHGRKVERVDVRLDHAGAV
jgi:hypothetical protein